MADLSSFRALIDAVELALDELGYKPSPYALDTPLPTPKRHKGYAIDVRDFLNAKKFGDRDCAMVAIRIVLQVQHKLRPGAHDQVDDLAVAGTGVIDIVGSLMGSAELNALGHVAFDRAPTKRDKTGEWLLSEVAITVSVEVWSLDA